MISDPGKIILVNGTSSAGKTTLCHALVEILPLPFWYLSSDQLIAAGMRPDSRLDRGDFEWRTMRPSFFDGFHRMIPAFASVGNNMLIEHIVEERSWGLELFNLLQNFDLFVVSVHCSEDQLVVRERERGDRTVGEAMFHMKTYDFVKHDIEVDSANSSESNAHLVVEAWQRRAAV